MCDFSSFLRYFSVQSPKFHSAILSKNRMFGQKKDPPPNHRVISTSLDIFLREGLGKDMSITSGMRQGCNLSATIFKMITYKIIERMDKKIKEKGNKLLTIRRSSMQIRGVLKGSVRGLSPGQPPSHHLSRRQATSCHAKVD